MTSRTDGGGGPGGEVTWEDRSGYSQRSPRGTVPPSIWALEVGGLRISVHRLLSIPGEWYLSCPALRMSDVGLKAKTPRAAAKEALRRVREEAEGLYLLACRAIDQASFPEDV